MECLEYILGLQILGKVLWERGSWRRGELIVAELGVVVSLVFTIRKI
jgi:hypothetical protein